MADIEITCLACKRKFNVSDKATGQKVFCPGCGNQVIVEQDADAPGRLRLKKQKFCTDCGAPLPPDGECNNCRPASYGPGSPGPGASAPRKSTNPWPLIVILIVVMILLAGAGVFWKRAPFLNKTKEPEPTTDVPSGVQTPAQPDTAQQPGGDPYPLVDQTAIRREVRELMDEKCPVAIREKRVSLRLNTGRICSGKFVEIRDGNVMLRSSTGNVRTISLDDLDSPSRSKCDPEFRNAIFEKAVARRIQEEQEKASSATSTE